jgi:hypothetical protein
MFLSKIEFGEQPEYVELRYIHENYEIWCRYIVGDMVKQKKFGFYISGQLKVVSKTMYSSRYKRNESTYSHVHFDEAKLKSEIHRLRARMNIDEEEHTTVPGDIPGNNQEPEESPNQKEVTESERYQNLLNFLLGPGKGMRVDRIPTLEDLGTPEELLKSWEEIKKRYPIHKNDRGCVCIITTFRGPDSQKDFSAYSNQQTPEGATAK